MATRRKSMATESTWSEIAERAIEAAEEVKVEGVVFVRGLEEIVDALTSRLEAAREEFGEALEDAEIEDDDGPREDGNLFDGDDD